ncbi:MAG: hypothetical protein E2581_02385 [Pseudomonas sp.]|nr:hypothetical protein C4Q26_06370 [Pseudomonas sp. SWI44]MPS97347.1 hypothetical protein [Pseudomonas sp.]
MQKTFSELEYTGKKKQTRRGGWLFMQCLPKYPHTRASPAIFPSQAAHESRTFKGHVYSSRLM